MIMIMYTCVYIIVHLINGIDMFVDMEFQYSRVCVCMYLLLFGSIIINVLFPYMCVCVHTVSIIDLYRCARPALHVRAVCVPVSSVPCTAVCVCVCTLCMCC